MCEVENQVRLASKQNFSKDEKDEVIPEGREWKKYGSMDGKSQGRGRG
jgi:hypothetical protein